jgi:putative ABC transport system permease protein
VSVPLVWYSIYVWLQTFAYRIDINPWFFAVAGVMTLLIAFLAIATQAVRAALSNPVKSLKSE